jgi:GTP cyclohydrolase III
MFLAYLDLDAYAEYVQPVYVFLGNDNFVGYVPAIDDKYLAP